MVAERNARTAAKLEYFTVPVRDVARGKTFYGALFGWDFRDEADTYAHVSNMEGPAGGVAKMEESEPQVWFRVENIKAAVANVQALGGTADEPSQSASGWSSRCVDDQGTRFNLWEAAPGLA